MRWLIGILALLAPTAAPADSLDGLREAVVIVVARAVDEGNGNAEVATQGTGFFINANGFLVTSHHLIDKLGPTINRASLRFEIHFDTFSNPLPANNIYASPEADIMVLYAPVGNRRIETLKPARRNRANIQIATTPIYVAGFAAGYDYSLVPGVVTSWAGPISPLIPSWSTNLTLASGQSGSPIVIADRRVVAVARASDLDNATRGIVVPIDLIPTQYWDSPDGEPERLNLAAATSPAGGQRIVVTTSQPSRRPYPAARPISMSADACGPLTRTFEIAATEGWDIVPNTVTLSAKSVAGGGAQAEVTRQDESGITVQVRLQPAGRCLSIFTRSVASGPIVRYEATLNFEERPQTNVQQDVVLVDAAAIEGVELPLAQNPRTLNFFVKAPNGALTSFRPRGNELKRKDGATVLDVERVTTRLEQ